MRSHPRYTSFGELSLPARINLGALGLGVAALTVRLWPEWRANPDLSHGLFMPLVFLLLLHESRSRGTARFVADNLATRIVFGAALLGGVTALALAGLYAAAVDWSHALVNVTLTWSLVLFLLSGLLLFARGSVRFMPFNWSALVAIGLWLFTAPIPPGTYTRLTLTLQLWVSEGVLRVLHLFGIAALRHGNIIDLANASVGVEEACSGVRSLISCVFAGLLFSATLVRRPWSRAVIVALAAPLALLMNFARSLALTLLANRGIDISGTWHDATGFAVLAVTAAALGGLALLLERGDRKGTSMVPPAASHTVRGTAPDRFFTLGSAVALAMVVFFLANTRQPSRNQPPAPDLFALLPGSAAGWQVKTSDLYEFRGALQTDHLAQRHYVDATRVEPLEIMIYVAYWNAGQAPVSLVASHTPDACWPGSGWEVRATDTARIELATAGRMLPAAEHRVFVAGDRPQHVWFWHVYDGRPISYRDPYSAIELLRIAARYGFRRAGSQVFVRISSNRPWSAIAQEPLLSEFFSRMQPLGL